jgi:hypothetical protein
MTMLVIFALIAAFVIYAVGGLFSPAGVVVVIGALAGWAVVHRAKRRRGGAPPP